MKSILLAAIFAVAAVSAHAAFVKDMTPEQIKAEVAQEKNAGVDLNSIIKAAILAGVSPEAVFDAYVAIEIEQGGPTGAGRSTPSFVSAGGSSFSGGGGGAASRN